MMSTAIVASDWRTPAARLLSTARREKSDAHTSLTAAATAPRSSAGTPTCVCVRVHACVCMRVCACVCARLRDENVHQRGSEPER